MFGIVNPLPGYVATDVDETADPKYYGFVDASGKWYIMQSTTTGSVMAFRYAAGNSGYAAAWSGKTGLTYKIINEVV